MKLSYTSSITRYENSYPSLSVFFMSASPKESDRESFHAKAEGDFRGKKTAFSVIYKEEDGTGASLIYEDDTLIFARGGTKAEFKLSKSTAFSYASELGELAVSAYTERLDVKEKEGMILLSLTYYMHVSDMVQKTVMKWKLF